jgi:hypothetical protein
MDTQGYVYRPVKFIDYGYRAGYQKDMDKKEEILAL